MFVPGLMQRVRLTGIDEVYLVTRVDHATQAVDLLPLTYGQRQLQTVPFMALEQIPGVEAPRLKPS
jgi:hypothetical protein